MSAARRSLLTATAAGSLLGALWFVPSANATDHHAPAADRSVRTSGVAHTTHGSPDASTANDPAAQTDRSSSDTAVSGQNSTAEDSTGQGSGTPVEGQALADTGSVNTTPYLFGGTAFLGLGAAFVAYSVRRGREGETA